MLKIKRTITLIACAGGLLVCLNILVSAQCANISNVKYPSDSPQCQAAYQAMGPALLLVEGAPNGFTDTTAKMSPATLNIYITALANKPKYVDKFKAGLEMSDAANFLKEYVVYKHRELEVLTNAFREVYGREETASEYEFYLPQIDALKAWYSTIVIAESGKLNADPNLRPPVINAAYLWAMGRDATAGEISYWKPRTEHYRLIVAASRQYLYSPNGKKDLTDTIRRAYLEVHKKDPTDVELNAAIAEAAQHKWIYADIVYPKHGIIQNFAPGGRDIYAVLKYPLY